MNDNMKWVVLIVLLLVFLFTLNKLFAGVGAVTGAVTDTVSDTAHRFGIAQSEKAKAIKNLKAFKPTYYQELQKKGNTLLITLSAAKMLAAEIKDSVTLGIYSDDARILGVFRQLKTQSQVSFLAKVFYDTYKTDMLMYFYSPMSDAYLVQLYDTVDSLPLRTV